MTSPGSSPAIKALHFRIHDFLKFTAAAADSGFVSRTDTTMALLLRKPLPLLSLPVMPSVGFWSPRDVIAATAAAGVSTGPLAAAASKSAGYFPRCVLDRFPFHHDTFPLRLGLH